MIRKILTLSLATLSLLAVADIGVEKAPTDKKEDATLVGWMENFKFPQGKTEKDKVLPGKWEIKTKIGTAASKFYIKEDPSTKKTYLFMDADKESGSVILEIEKLDIKKYPILRWKWKADILPTKGDGRNSDTDDQAISIYVGTGSIFIKKTVSYRWDTETPKNAEGQCSYGAGTIKIKWHTLRNKEDFEKGDNGWFVEERNVAEDFKKAWGFYPESVYVSISCNSQYTGSKGAARLEWIGFAKSDKDSKEENAQK